MIRTGIASIALLSLGFSGLADNNHQLPVTAVAQPAVEAPPSVTEITKPLADLIGKGESDTVGGYDAANAGRPLDLGHNGITKVFGRTSSEVTVGELLLAQAQGRIHAVGRYQIIGVTLKEIVTNRCISGSELFTEEVQDRAFLCLIKKKRPAVWHYLSTGKRLAAAADALALEWASMPWRHGGSYYGGQDQAHATRPQVVEALQAVRRNAAEAPGVL